MNTKRKHCSAAFAAVVLLAARLAAQEAVAKPSQLDLQLELAGSDRFYLELDPGRSELRLLFAGVVLKEYPVRAIARATPSVAFVPLGGGLDFVGRIWGAGDLDPDRPEVRLEIQPPGGAADSTVVPPLPPHFEDMPVPGSFRLRFAPDMVVAVSSPRAAEQNAFSVALGRLWDKLVEARDAVADRRPRLHLTLDRADAQHLYRSLPPDTQLLVLEP